VNGEIVVDNGKITGRRSGKILKKENVWECLLIVTCKAENIFNKFCMVNHNNIIVEM
jgi:hypothetical protein